MSQNHHRNNLLNSTNGTRFILLVSSAKGGVGKSTVAKLAEALQNLGLKIGIFAFDVYGPSTKIN